MGRRPPRRLLSGAGDASTRPDPSDHSRVKGHIGALDRARKESKGRRQAVGGHAARAASYAALPAGLIWARYSACAARLPFAIRSRPSRSSGATPASA